MRAQEETREEIEDGLRRRFERRAMMNARRDEDEESAVERRAMMVRENERERSGESVGELE